MLLEHVAASWDRILLWGFLATAVMTIVMQGSRGAGAVTPDGSSPNP